jgi:hypothetical protein
MNRLVFHGIVACASVLAVLAGAANAQTGRASWPDLTGIYRAGGLPVQPCGRNEWMLRSFETDQFCLGSNDGFPFSEQGLENWAACSPIDDPVLRCSETFPRTPMRGRPMRMSYGDESTLERVRREFAGQLAIFP